MFVGIAELDVLLPGSVGSLKDKRSVVRPVLAALQQRAEVAAAEVGGLDLLRRTTLGVAAVANEPGRCRELLEGCERLVAGRPELELLSVRTRLVGPHDDA